MSCVRTYKITQDGKVLSHEDVRNPWGCAMYVWTTMTEKYLGKTPGFCDNFPVWKLFATPKMSERDSIVMGFTFDGVWIKRENIPRLVTALRSFWEDHHTSRWPDGTVHEVVPTIPRVADILEGIATDETIKGVCFNQTSVCSNPWWVRTGEDEGRPFDFTVDTKDLNDHEPWELFEAMADESLAAKERE